MHIKTNNQLSFTKVYGHTFVNTENIKTLKIIICLFNFAFLYRNFIYISFILFYIFSQKILFIL